MGVHSIKRAFQRHLLSLVLRGFCRPLRIQGAEALSGIRGPVIIAANHSGHLDTLLVLNALPDGLRQRVAVAAFVLSRKGCCGRSLAKCEDILRSGRSLLIYPEDGRSPDGTLQRFKPAVGLLAARLGVPVVPIHLRRARDPLPKGGLPRPAATTVRVGEPVRYGRDADPRAVADDLRSRILELSAKVRLDRSVRNHYYARDVIPNVIFVSDKG